MPDYKRYDPLGWGGDPARGAALGRSTIIDEAKDYNGKVYVRRIPLNAGGYDKNGTYFGVGNPLFWVANDAGTIDYVIRAKNRSEAVANARELFPEARIWEVRALSHRKNVRRAAVCK
jgi:hypothetical protein